MKINIYGDFGNYQDDSKFYCPSNQNKIGKIKDEFKREIISEFFRLKSKMYSLVTVNGKESIKMLLKTQDIKNLLMLCLTKKIMRQNMKRIQSEPHNIGYYDASCE